LPAQQPAPVQESAFVPLHLLIPDGRRIEIRPGDILGRAGAGGELFREHAAVSRQHVRFKYNDGVWHVTDLNSTNGTWLEGIRLVPENAAKVTTGQEIRMASTFRAVLKIDMS
jgi:pSer/pThr/pTyr-binding forkhead associated (FHA) protein